jgi:hypothetical protein
MSSFWEALCAFGHRLADRRGQGTVEYLGLVLAVGALLLAVSVQVKGGGSGVNVTQTIVTADPVVAGSESARKMRDAAFLAGV